MMWAKWIIFVYAILMFFTISFRTMRSEVPDSVNISDEAYRYCVWIVAMCFYAGGIVVLKCAGALPF